MYVYVCVYVSITVCMYVCVLAHVLIPSYYSNILLMHLHAHTVLVLLALLVHLPTVSTTLHILCMLLVVLYIT